MHNRHNEEVNGWFWAAAAVLITAGVLILGYIENNDMKNLNNLFFNTNLCNKFSVMNYLTQLQFKPQWRMCLMVSLLGGFGLTLIYYFLPDVHPAVYFLITVAFLWIGVCAAHSYWAYHCVLPNGAEFTVGALSSPGCYAPGHID